MEGGGKLLTNLLHPCQHAAGLRAAGKRRIIIYSLTVGRNGRKRKSWMRKAEVFF